ncbi:hypothetical protein HC762_00120 [bacterium]|nr:hypothetical protein [bacterium]
MSLGLDGRRADGRQRRDATPNPEEENLTRKFIERLEAEEEHKHHSP